MFEESTRICYMFAQNTCVMIEKCPNLSTEQFAKAFFLLKEPEVKKFVDEINEEYLYWTDVKYKKQVENLSPTELWYCVKATRIIQETSVWKKYNIAFTLTNRMQYLCHYFDMHFGGSWGSPSIIPERSKERYLISSLMEEAISSSQMEGAATTRKLAKEMLRKGITPRSRSEQMIHNNYECIKFIKENKDVPFSKELLLKIHSIMTLKTLDNPSGEGRFRDNNEVVVADCVTNEIVYNPPAFEDIPEFIETLTDFINDDSNIPFIHPIIRAIIIHFMIAYIHPFADGNGRTARALFYWYMLRKGYWLTEFLSISRVIYKSKKSYEKAYLYTEYDDNDIGYFIIYNLRTLELAFKELQRYIDKKTSEENAVSDFIKLGEFNERQAIILNLVKNNPKILFTIKELQNRFSVSHPTVKLDVDALVEKGLLDKIPVNKVKFNYIKGHNFDKLISED